MRHVFETPLVNYLYFLPSVGLIDLQSYRPHDECVNSFGIVVKVREGFENLNRLNRMLISPPWLQHVEIFHSYPRRLLKSADCVIKSNKGTRIQYKGIRNC